LFIIVHNTKPLNILAYFFVIIANLRLTTKKMQDRKMTDRIAGYGNKWRSHIFHPLIFMIRYILYFQAS